MIIKTLFYVRIFFGRNSAARCRNGFCMGGLEACRGTKESYRQYCGFGGVTSSTTTRKTECRRLVTKKTDKKIKIKQHKKDDSPLRTCSKLCNHSSSEISIVVCWIFVCRMFDLQPHPSAPVVISTTHQSYRLARDRGLPPSLPAENSRYLVELTGDEDPANAKSWSFGRKMKAAAVLGFDTLIASWGSSVYSAAIEPVAFEFGVSNIVAILGLTLYICGFATGMLTAHLVTMYLAMLISSRSIVLRSNF
jgi:hypothetical protein